MLLDVSSRFSNQLEDAVKFFQDHPVPKHGVVINDSDTWYKIDENKQVDIIDEDIGINSRDETVRIINITKEYTSIPPIIPENNEMLPYSEGHDRYEDIRPYKNNLLPSGSSYRNHVSPIKLKNDDIEYIASQSPLPVDFNGPVGAKGDKGDEFWKMIKEQNIGLIVNLVSADMYSEKEATIYWPEPREISHPENKKINFYVFEKSDALMIHYPYWVENLCPSVRDFSDLLREFFNKRDEMLDGKKILVHCMAGIGQTGTFLSCVDALLSEEDTDIKDIVSSLRSQRCYMVNTLDQYLLIHDTLDK